jgi:hypothetical protein
LQICIYWRLKRDHSYQVLWINRGLPARSKLRAHKITMRDLDNARGCAVKQSAINPDSLGVKTRRGCLVMPTLTQPVALDSF